MQDRYHLVFDDIMIKQLKKAAKNQQIKQILTKMLDKLEVMSPDAGKLLDSRLFISEIKSKHPPIRLYFKYNLRTNEIYIFEYEMKSSEEGQHKTIEAIKKRILKS